MSGARGTIRKYFDVGPTAVSASSVYSGGTTGFSSGISTPLSNANAWLTSLTSGSGDNQRVGQSIAIETLDVRVKVSPNNTDLNQGLRMLILADNECDGVVPDIADILTQSTVATGAIQSYLNPAYFGRFKIIEDKMWDWQQLPELTPYGMSLTMT